LTGYAGIGGSWFFGLERDGAGRWGFPPIGFVVWQPSGTYLDRPPQETSGNGDALQFYNHSDPELPFSELECHAPARVLPPGDRQSATADYFLAKGRLEKLLEAAQALLGQAVDPTLLFV
jgi:hypothetical protein